MIAEYQPTIFPDDSFVVRFSSIEDGNMKNGTPELVTQVSENRRRFLGRWGLELESGHLIKVTFDTDDYCRYGAASDATQSLTRPHEYVTPAHDALLHDKPGEALILPLADCCGLVLYDEKQHKFMVSHLGRHSVVQNGGQRSVDFMAETYGSQRSDLRAYLSPAAGKANYPLFDLGGMSLQEAILGQLEAAGIDRQHIEASPFDTTTDERLFSHSEFLKGNRDVNGRQILIAALLPAERSSVTLE